MPATLPATRGTPPVWTRLSRARLESLGSRRDEPARALIVGSAGSGKSTMLRHFTASLRDSRREAVTFHADTEVEALGPDVVLLVDDAQHLDAASIERLTARIADPDAAIVLAVRTWPRTAPIWDAIHGFETSLPAVVLGYVTAEDVFTHLAAARRSLDPECVHDLVDLCGEVTWLVSEAIATHDDDECRGHQEISAALHDLILHRLDVIDPGVRSAVEGLCLSVAGAEEAPEADDVIAAARAEGLTRRNGVPVPAVRMAVRSTMTADRCIDLLVESADPGAEAFAAGALDGVRDPRVARMLQDEGDTLLGADPMRADALYERAAASGADLAAIGVRRGLAAWSLDRVDAAGAALDEAPVGAAHPDHERATDLAAAVWAARGFMDTSHQIYCAAESQSTNALITALAAADARAFRAEAKPPVVQAIPSAAAVATQLLERGMRATLTPTGAGALSDLVRAAEVYTVAKATEPTPEIPAVIAAIAAINLGELDVAGTVLDSAIAEGHAGAWARRRLVLWRAWVSMQWQHPREVEALLQSACADRRSVPLRDRILADAIRVGLARRHSDAAGLAVAWHAAADSILRAQFDVFGILPLGEFIVSAARVADTARMGPHLDRALAQVTALGSPPLWGAHLWWAGIQQGILLNQPEALTPFARALVAAAPHSHVAAVMAKAGRIWTSVLAGSVDADGVEESAGALAEIGLAWDGARLAGHAAARTDVRRDIGRLLACARQLHPQEDLAQADGEVVPLRLPSFAASLSPREREVAALVVQGLTYAEIGESIYISPRTAEHHIARIRQRLGATSRSDLIAKLRLAMEGSGEEHDSRSRAEAV